MYFPRNTSKGVSRDWEKETPEWLWCPFSPRLLTIKSRNTKASQKTGYRYEEVSRKIQFRKELKRITNGYKPDWLRSRHLVITGG